MRRALVSVLVGVGMLISPVAYGATTPLAPGGAAGVHEANLTRVPVYAWVGGALVIVGWVWVLSGNTSHHPGTTTTSAPNTLH